MNTKIRSIRFVFSLVLALSTLGFAASTALAQKPVKTEYPPEQGYTVIYDVCGFPVENPAILYVTETDLYDRSGSLTRIDYHIVEQDTFIANGKSLSGVPFTFNVKVLLDNEGNPTHVYADGVTEKVWLPDGSLFISAGRVDFAAHGFPEIILSPDHGNPGNIAGFCAALAP
jgi:hypothetical protein